MIYRVNRNEIPEGKCHWSLTVSNPQVSKVKTFFTSDVTSRKASRGGVAFIRDTESPAFGKIVVSNGNSQGFDIYSPILEHEGNLHSDMFNPNNSNSPGRITAYGGKIFVNDWSDAKSGIYVFDPANPTIAPYQIFQGERQSGGEFIYDGTLIGGSVTGCDLYGTGGDRKLYTFCEDYPTSGNGKKLVRYSIGTDSIISSIPDKVYENTSALMGSTYVEVLATERGLFAAQRQANRNNTPNSPTLVFADYDDNILFNSGDSEVKDMFFDSTGGIAINDAGNLFALSSIGNIIGIYRLSWSEANAPSFEKLYDITVPVNGDIPQLEFDIAGNLYAYTKAGGMMAFAVPDPDNILYRATTNAPSALAVYGLATGINDATTNDQPELKVFPSPAKSILNVESPEDIQSLSLYSLSGSKVNASATISGNKAMLNVSGLAPGNYIIRANNQSARIIKR